MQEEHKPIFRDFLARLSEIAWDEMELTEGEDLLTESDFDVVGLVSEPDRKYTLPTGLVVNYLIELLNPHTTDAQWRLGRTLINQLVEPHFRKANRMGRPNKVVDRIFQCVHVEWCIDTHEMGTTEAIAETVQCLGASSEQLSRWYRRGKDAKGEAADERAVATLMIDMVDQIKLILSEERLAELVEESGFIEQIKNIQDPPV